jgi:hypothetical protein
MFIYEVIVYCFVVPLTFFAFDKQKLIETYDKIENEYTIKYKKEIEEYRKLQTKEDFVNYYMKIYEKLIKKQERDIPNDLLKLIYNHFNNIINKIDIKGFDWVYLMNNLGVLSESNDQNDIIRISNIGTNLAKFLGCFMDLYLMLRMFRKFKHIKYQYSSSPRNIIIYAGDWHSNNYRTLLKDLEFDTIFETKTYEELGSCIDIEKLKTPLFSEIIH